MTTQESKNRTRMSDKSASVESAVSGEGTDGTPPAPHPVRLVPDPRSPNENALAPQASRPSVAGVDLRLLEVLQAMVKDARAALDVAKDQVTLTATVLQTRDANLEEANKYYRALATAAAQWRAQIFGYKMAARAADVTRAEIARNADLVDQAQAELEHAEAALADALELRKKAEINFERAQSDFDKAKSDVEEAKADLALKTQQEKQALEGYRDRQQERLDDTQRWLARIKIDKNETSKKEQRANSRESTGTLVEKRTAAEDVLKSAINDRRVELTDDIPAPLRAAMRAVSASPATDSVAAAIVKAFNNPDESEETAGARLLDALKKDSKLHGHVHDTSELATLSHLGRDISKLVAQGDDMRRSHPDSKNLSLMKKPDTLATEQKLDDKKAVQDIGQYAAKAVLEFKKLKMCITAVKELTATSLTDDTNHAVGQGTMYGVALLNAQTWRKEVVTVVTNFRQAIVVCTRRADDGSDVRDLYESKVSFLLKEALASDDKPDASDERVQELAQLMVAFATADPAAFGWTQPSIQSDSDATGASIPIEFVQELGKGLTSTVIEARSAQVGSTDATRYAIKIRKIENNSGPSLRQFETEQELLRKLQDLHLQENKSGTVTAKPFNFPQIVGALKGSIGAFAMTPVCRKGETGLKRQNLRDIVKAVEWLHSKGYVHLDLRESNILLRSRQGGVLISDLGFAQRVEDNTFDVEKFAGARQFSPGKSARGDNRDPYAIDLQIFVRVCFRKFAPGLTKAKLDKVHKAMDDCDWTEVERDKDMWTGAWQASDQAARECKYSKLVEALLAAVPA